MLSLKEVVLAFALVVVFLTMSNTSTSDEDLFKRIHDEL
jgi:hypothetical protein